MRRFWFIGFIATCFLSLAQASGISVAPVRIKLHQGNTIDSFTVLNTGKKAVVVQSQLVNWHQRAGKDIYSPSKDLLISPPIVEIPAGQIQVFRVALRKPKFGEQEKAYRLFLTEVIKRETNANKKTAESKKKDALKFAMRLSLPIFVKPTTVEEPKLEANFIQRRRDVKLGLVNPTNRHLQIIKVSITANKQVIFQQEMMKYLLPGQAMNFAIKPLRKIPRKTPVLITVNTDAGPINITRS